MAKTNRQELFETVSRGYDKEQVERYLKDMMENHVCQQEQLQEMADAQEQAAANALTQLVALQQELGEALYHLQSAKKDAERLQRENHDCLRKVALADKMISNARAEAAASAKLKEEMELSLREALEHNCRLEKQLEESKANAAESHLVEHMKAEMAALRSRNEELEGQMAIIRRKVMEAAKARRARLNQQD